ncbi:MAG: GDP-mannose 4,6-dehydratase [Candidatus Omnitrophica bacterium]|nr:GDP-mannose 4,6-dehydratase [Candidatus Omnitrophota bacterium]
MADTRRIVVIGSNSFSGSDFIDLLLEDPRNEVIGISRSPEKSATFLPYKRRQGAAFTFSQIDVNRNMSELVRLLDDRKPSVVVNFAAQSEVAPSWDYPEQWFQTNVASLVALANYLKDQSWCWRYVHISSPEVYGTCVGRVREDAPLNPSTPYAASKAAADLFLFTLVKQFRFPLIMIRATNVYGAGQQPWKIIPKSMISLKRGQTIPLHGGGVAVKSYIHIRDVSRGELAAMEIGTPGSIYHLSPDRGYAVREVVERICVLLGRDRTVTTTVVGERPGQDAAYVIDSTRARTMLGWEPKVSLDEGLADVKQWVERYWDVLKDVPLEYQHQSERYALVPLEERETLAASGSGERGGRR